MQTSHFLRAQSSLKRTDRVGDDWKDAVRLFLIRNLFSYLNGITAGHWLRLLWHNRFAVDAPYWPRALLLSASSVINSTIALYEGHCWDVTQVDLKHHPPLFILGHWRNGTTYLHRLLALDEHFAYPSLYQTLAPHTFLTTEPLAERLLWLLMPKRRLMDNVANDPGAPHEDEFALCTLTLLSPYLSWVFPRHKERYDRYLTFADVDAADTTRWKDALLFLVKKLTWKHRRCLLLKSPPHTGRIRLLLELFPEARFLHIRRNPYHVFQSTVELLQRALPAYLLQRPHGIDLEAWVIERYEEMYRAFFEERPLIPEGRFYEICFEDLERDPIDTVANVYTGLGLPEFDKALPRLEASAALSAGYRKNEYLTLSAQQRERLGQAWKKCFTAWNYPE